MSPGLLSAFGADPLRITISQVGELWEVFHSEKPTVGFTPRRVKGASLRIIVYRIAS